MSLFPKRGVPRDGDITFAFCWLQIKEWGQDPWVEVT